MSMKSGTRFASLALAAVFAVPISATTAPLFAQEAGEGPEPADVVGDWEGVLAVEQAGVEYRLVFHIDGAEDGSLSATLDSPDQGAFGIPCQAPEVTGKEVTVPVAAVAGQYRATVSDDGSMMSGTWSQSGMDFPLNLERVADDSGEAGGPEAEGA